MKRQVREGAPPYTIRERGQQPFTIRSEERRKRGGRRHSPSLRGDGDHKPSVNPENQERSHQFAVYFRSRRWLVPPRPRRPGVKLPPGKPPCRSAGIYTATRPLRPFRLCVNSATTCRCRIRSSRG